MKQASKEAVKQGKRQARQQARKATGKHASNEASQQGRKEHRARPDKDALKLLAFPQHRTLLTLLPFTIPFFRLPPPLIASSSGGRGGWDRDSRWLGVEWARSTARHLLHKQADGTTSGVAAHKDRSEEEAPVGIGHQNAMPAHQLSFGHGHLTVGSRTRLDLSIFELSTLHLIIFYFFYWMRVWIHQCVLHTQHYMHTHMHACTHARTHTHVRHTHQEEGERVRDGPNGQSVCWRDIPTIRFQVHSPQGTPQRPCV